MCSFRYMAVCFSFILSTDTPLLTFASSYTVFDATKDGIDSNKNITMTGGTVIMYGSTDNEPLDFGNGHY